MIRALIFDFDGLVLDTETPDYQAWQEIYQSYGLQLPLDGWVKVIGTLHTDFDPFTYLAERSSQPLDREAIEHRHRQREVALIEGLPVMPGVARCLAEARRLGLRLGLASSSSCRWVTGHLDRLGLLADFDCLRTRDDVPAPKPDPAVYLSALACLGLPAAEALAFEDSPNGLLAARRAGLRCVVVPNGMTRPLAFDQPSLILDSLADLPLTALLAHLGEGVAALPGLVPGPPGCQSR
jgi:HAD superfamily hydrolase (TIGR01509 family)